MRLTSYMCIGKRVYRDTLQSETTFRWRTRASKLPVDRLRVPDEVINNSGNPLRNAENMFSSTRYDDLLAEEIEIGVSPQEAKLLEERKSRKLFSYTTRALDPRYNPHAKPSLLFSSDRRFSKGLDQAALLTNTLIFTTPPPILSDFIGKIGDQLVNKKTSDSKDECRRQLRCSVERAILHANVWHTDEVKLPRRFQPELPIWKHKTEFGIYPSQSTRYLFQNLFRILEFQTANSLEMELGLSNSSFTHGDNLPLRWTTKDRILETFYYWGKENVRVGFSEIHDLVVNGQQPAPLFVSEQEVIHAISRTSKLPVDSLGPMSPLIDLTSTQSYRKESTEGWLGTKSRTYPHPHVITINLSLPTVWSDFLEPEANPVIPEQRQAAALMHCFASAVARSHTLGIKYGNLSEPISILGVCSDGVYFDFIAFQLNTLNILNSESDYQSEASALKNMAWIDGNHRLFNKIIPRRSMLRNTQYRDLDMQVFDRLASYYLWGLMGNQVNNLNTRSFHVDEQSISTHPQV